MTLTCVIEPSQTPLMSQVSALFTPIEAQDLFITHLEVGSAILSEFRRHPDTFDRTSLPRGHLIGERRSEDLAGVIWGAQVWHNPSFDPYEVHLVGDDLLPEAGDRERRRGNFEIGYREPEPLPPVTSTVWDRL